MQTAHSRLEHSQQLELSLSTLFLKHAVMRERAGKVELDLLHRLVVGHQQQLAIVAVPLGPTLTKAMSFSNFFFKLPCTLPVRTTVQSWTPGPPTRLRAPRLEHPHR